MGFAARALSLVGLQTPVRKQAAAARIKPTIRGSIFSGASTDRLNGDSTPWTLSPDYEVRFQFRFLRARARELVRNNPYARGFVRELASNIIGPHGVLLQAKVKTAIDQLHKSTNAEIERGWKEWSYPENASADGHDSWVDIQRITIETLACDGEVFLRRVQGFENPFAYTLQFIDADLIDELYNVPAAAGQNEIRMGVEVDAWNRPVAYWSWTRYAEDMNGRKRERIRIPASELLHLFIRYRPNQTRGVSWFAPILQTLRYLDGYEFSELQAARASAAKMGFIVNTSEAAIAGYDPPQPGEEPRTMDVEPGLITELLPGQEFQDFNPTHPTTAYKDFTSSVLRAIARGLGVSYSTLTGDLAQANYSSLRAGLLPERDGYRAIQEWLICHMHRVVYRDWIRMALLAGAVRVDSRLAADYRDVAWKPRGFKWVDPFNDLKASKMAIDLGLDSRTRLAGEQGRDFEEVVNDLAQEEEYAEAMGVDVSGNQMAGVNATTVSPEGQAEDASEPTAAPKAPTDSPNPNDDDEDADGTSGRSRTPRLVALGGSR